MGYNTDDSYVRVDFFKPSGKWYTTEAVKWSGSYLMPSKQIRGQLIHEAFAKSLRDHFKNCPNRLSEMDAICIEPYHEYAHPIQLKAGEWIAKAQTERKELKCAK